jgi:hypothetical protein
VAARRGGSFSGKFNALDRPNGASDHIENKWENPEKSNGLGASGAHENENPGALAGATGADNLGSLYVPEEYRNRYQKAKNLALAIAECHPDDACKVMEAAINDLRRGMPIAPFLTIMDEARTWASFAMRAELKAYCLACFEHMSKSDQGAFLLHVGGRADG